MGNIYTKENWAQDGTLKIKVGQYVADDVVEELRDSVPPTTYKASCFQPGEAYTHSADYVELYMTFVIDNGMWKYIGLCPKGSNQPQPEMDYNLNESKRGLNSKKLYQIANEHGGLSPRHGYNFKRFNELTDNDVIGIVDEVELNRYKEASYKTRQEWAISKGFDVNKGDDVTFIPMNDWTWVAVIVRGDMLPDREWAETSYGKKRIERNKNKSQDGARNYIWSDANADKEKGLVGWSKRANEFARMKFNNEIANQKMNEHILTGLDEIPKTTNVRKFTDAVIKKLYRTSQPYTSHRFRDNDWRSLRSFVHTLEEVDGVKELNLNSTGSYKQSQEGAYKEYLVDIETTLGSKIGGFIRCHFCGSQENPWEVYDMTVNFYRDDENNNKINENNMSKIVLKEEDLMALVNESVKKVINEAVQNGELDEGFWGNIGQGIKGAFGGDANRVASAVRTGVDKAKNMGQNAYNAVKNAGQKVAGAAKDAYGTVQTGVNQRVNAFKANYAAGQNADKINNVISTLRELQQNGVISGAKTNATIDELERLLQMGMKGMRGRATQASNRIGKEE